MTETNMQLVDWLDDLCVRFIINLPKEELESVERICFQVEEAQWFYEDFIRPLDPTLPSMNLKRFCLLIFQHCPLLSTFSEYHHTQAYSEFLAYKTRVPVRGAIMLNDDMDHAVLVKGWKKGAKWSFPRGKINKDEKDLDCAIREVYEETGYDIKEAGLIRDESDTKYIEVSMREQHMRLYVFRGVPMDTYFEPRTRKEISKISWYKLSDLPTVKRNKQQQQQNNGEDMLRDNMFYMVAPFLGPLRHWIKQQRKEDRQKAEKGIHLAPPPVPAETDVEETEIDEEAARIGELTTDGGRADSRDQPEEDNLSQLLANLGRGHRASDNLPELSVAPEATPDPAAELKRLLSVGNGQPELSDVPKPAQQQNNHNSLLAMLQGRPGPPAAMPPRSPFEPISSPPTQPKSPRHHHPRLPHFSNMQPPPAFPISPPQVQPLHRPYPPEFPGQNGFNGQSPQQFQPPPPPPNAQHPVFSSRVPNIQEALNREAPRPYRTGDPQFVQAPQFPGAHRSTIPPASKLPPPKLTAHTLNLLNAFKSIEKPALVSPPKPQAQQPAEAPTMTTELPRSPETFSQPSAQVPLPLPSILSPRTVFNGHAPIPTVAPNQRNAHQDSLLNLFRSPSTSVATPPLISQQNLAPEPIELAAHPSPAGPKPKSSAKAIHPHVGEKVATLQAMLPPLNVHDKHDPRNPTLTSATVSGPLNAPDFDTVRKQTRANETNGHVHGAVSPLGQPENRSGAPISILPRPGATTASPARSPRPRHEPVGAISPKTKAVAAKPVGFHPQILRRPQQPTSVPIAGPTPVAPASNTVHTQPIPLAPKPTKVSDEYIPVVKPSHLQQPLSFDRRESLPVEQKTALLSLFSKPTRPVTPRMPTSGVISPVSPLPEKASLHGSPAGLEGRSRISSIGEGVPSNVLGQGIKPVSPAAVSVQVGTAMPGSIVSDGKMKQKTPVTPVDKSFLLGFLEDVARGKR